MSARHALAVAVAFLPVLLVVPEASAQVCRDLDGDGATMGFRCLAGTDCEDLAWQRRPGVAEACDGLDNDCDTDMDLGCDRFCDEKTLLPTAVLLQVEDLPQARGGCVGLFEDGILAVTRRLIGDDHVYYGRGHSRLGDPLGPSSAVGDPLTPTPLEIRCRMAAAGDRALLSYHDEHDPDGTLHRLMARVVDRLGRPLMPGPIDLSATSPFAVQNPWNDEHAVWDGERFYVFWTVATERESLLMSRIEADGTLANPATIVVTNDVNGLGETIQNVRAVWTGDHFVVVVSVDPDSFEDDVTLHTLKVTRDGQVLVRDTIPGRDSGPGPAIGMADDRVAVLWQRRTALSEGINFTRMAFTDLDAGYLTDPGVITLHEGDTPAVPQSGNKYLAWTGEMFGAAYATYENVGVNRAYEWRFSRVLSDGTTLDPGGALLADDATLDDVWGLHWNGREFWLYGVRGPQAFVQQRIMCDCGDADGDTFGACTGQDCDDTDPLANIAQLESCRGLTDDDCDGLVDCDDGQDCPGGAGPSDVTDLMWSGSSLSWSAPSGAERYDLARGLLSDLLRRGDLRQGDCAGLELASPSWPDDGRDPPVGDVLWYALRPEGQPCHLGSYGVGGVARDTEVCH